MAELEVLFDSDPLFSIHPQSSVKPPATFKSTSTESIFSRKFAGIMEPICSQTIKALTLVQLIVVVCSWSGISVFSALQAVPLTGLLALMLPDLKPSKRPPPKFKAPARKPNSKGGPVLSFTPNNLKLMVLIFLQEVVIASQVDNLYFYLASFALAAVLHLSHMESYLVDRILVRFRLLVQILISLTLLWKGLSISILIMVLFRAILSHICLLHIQYRANEFWRKNFSRGEFWKRFGDQMYQIVDTSPFPTFIIDKKDVLKLTGGNQAHIRIVFFNTSAEYFLSKLKDDPESETGPNFLDLIASEDSSVLLENVLNLQTDQNLKSTFTTKLPKILFSGNLAPTSYHCDLTMWSTTWKENEMVAVVFNNEMYLGSKSNRFATRYLKGLNYILDKTEHTVDGLGGPISKFQNRQIDAAKFTESVVNATIDLWNEKLIGDNFVIFEGFLEDQKKNFKPKILIINMIDLVAKDLCKKGVEIQLTFSPLVPAIIKSKLQMFRSLIFTVFKYYERNMEKGKIQLYVDHEANNERSPDDGESPFNMKLNFSISCPSSCQLPSREFLEMVSFSIKKDFMIKEDLNELLGLWFFKLRSALNLKVHFEISNNLHGVMKDEE